MLKLVSNKISRQGDKTTVEAKWRTEMKVPAQVRIKVERGELVDDGDSVMFEGDITDVNGILHGVAEMAWKTGWRPRGLMGHMARQIEIFKLPPDPTR